MALRNIDLSADDLEILINTEMVEYPRGNLRQGEYISVNHHVCATVELIEGLNPACYLVLHSYPL